MTSPEGWLKDELKALWCGIRALIVVSAIEVGLFAILPLAFRVPLPIGDAIKLGAWWSLAITAAVGIHMLELLGLAVISALPKNPPKNRFLLITLIAPIVTAIIYAIRLQKSFRPAFALAVFLPRGPQFIAGILGLWPVLSFLILILMFAKFFIFIGEYYKGVRIEILQREAE